MEDELESLDLQGLDSENAVGNSPASLALCFTSLKYLKSVDVVFHPENRFQGHEAKSEEVIT